MIITHSPKILLVGAGNMAREYAKVLKAQKVPFVVVGRGTNSARDFENTTGKRENSFVLTLDEVKKRLETEDGKKGGLRQVVKRKAEVYYFSSGAKRFIKYPYAQFIEPSGK